MKNTEKMILQAQVNILKNALNDVACLLIDIDLSDEGLVAGVYARCAYSRIESALSHADNTKGE